MSKLRTGIWTLILVFLMLLFFQNQTIFLAQRSLRLNLYFASYQTPELYEALFFLAALIIGYLFAYIFNLSDRFKARRTIRQLASANNSQRQEIAALRNEIQELKKISAPRAPFETPAEQAPPERIGHPELSMEPAAEASTEEIQQPVESEKSGDMGKK